jgi:hypothetical protein
VAALDELMEGSTGMRKFIMLSLAALLAPVGAATDDARMPCDSIGARMLVEIISGSGGPALSHTTLDFVANIETTSDTPEALECVTTVSLTEIGKPDTLRFYRMKFRFDSKGTGLHIWLRLTDGDSADPE